MRNMSDRLNIGPKLILFLLGAYVVSMGTVLFATLAVLIVMQPQTCSAMSRTLSVLWATIAALFIASVGLIGGVVWKSKTGVVGRVAAAAIFVAVLLASYIVIALSLMVAFNC